jgi:hypothetical protein
VMSGKFQAEKPGVCLLQNCISRDGYRGTL